MIKPTKRKLTKVVKKSKSRSNPRSTYNFTGIISDVVEDDLEFYLGKKVKVAFEFGNRSGGEISGKLEQNSDKLYFVSNSMGYLYFKTNDIGIMDPNEDTLLILIGKKLTERYLSR